MTEHKIRQGLAAAMTAVAVSTMTVGPAAAGAIFSFAKSGSTPGDLPVAIEMMFEQPSTPVTGNAFAGGFNGLRSFLFRMGAVAVDLDDLVALQQSCAAGNPFCNSGSLAYALTPESGSIAFNNTEFDFRFTYGEGWLTGGFNTDGPGPEACRRSNQCAFEGAWRSVPEPMAVGLLGAGLLGLLWGARRPASAA